MGIEGIHNREFLNKFLFRGHEKNFRSKYNHDGIMCAHTNPQVAHCKGVRENDKNNLHNSKCVIVSISEK